MGEFGNNAGHGNMDLMQQTGTIRCALLEEGGDKWGGWGWSVSGTHTGRALGASEEGLAGTGMGARSRQQLHLGSPWIRACWVMGQGAIAMGIRALES